MDGQSLEYKLIIDKAKKITNRSRDRYSSGYGELAKNKGVLERLHKDINVLQHNNTFTVLHPDGSSAPKRQFRKAARKLVSAALLPAMERQSLYNEHTTQSLLNLTIVTQSLYENAFRSKGYTASQLGKLRGGMDELVARLARMEKHMDSSRRMLDGSREGGSCSYAQAGEDVIIDFILKNGGIEYADVTYLDLGANHARELSNTYYAYLRGAKGVLVEANPALIPELKLAREGDTVMNCIAGVAPEQSKTLYVMSGDGLSTTDMENARAMCEANPAIFIEREVTVEVRGINEIAKSVSGGITILSIDTEGGECEILSALDFEKYRPFVIIVELVEYGTGLMHSTKRADIPELLESLGYEEFAFTGINGIFVDSKRGAEKI